MRSSRILFSVLLLSGCASAPPPPPPPPPDPEPALALIAEYELGTTSPDHVLRDFPFSPMGSTGEFGLVASLVFSLTDAPSGWNGPSTLHMIKIGRYTGTGSATYLARASAFELLGELYFVDEVMAQQSELPWPFSTMRTEVAEVPGGLSFAGSTTARVTTFAGAGADDPSGAYSYRVDYETPIFRNR